jgi:hypothetical protein
MKLIKPLTITNAMLTSSTVPETDYAAWSNTTSYTVGQYCILVSTHKVYQCLIAHVGASPDINLTGLTPKWLQISSTNRWSMFDTGWGTQTSVATPLTIVLTPASIINSLALLNLSATSVNVSMVATEGTVYSKTVDMLGGEVVKDWYGYFFDTISYKTDLVLTDLPPYGSGAITITINNTGLAAKCGNCVVGNVYELGNTQYNATAGIVDYSTKTTDTFGNTTIVKRKYSKRMTAKLEIDNTFIDDVVTTLAAYRSTSIVWIGAESIYTSLIVYGFYKDFDVDIAYPTVSYCSLTIEGLT